MKFNPHSFIILAFIFATRSFAMIGPAENVVLSSNLDLATPLEKFKEIFFLTNEEILLSPGRHQKMLMEGNLPISKSESKSLKCLLITYNPNPCAFLVSTGTTFNSKIVKAKNASLSFILLVSKKDGALLKTVSPFGTCSSSKSEEKSPSLEIRCHSKIVARIKNKTTDSEDPTTPTEEVEYSNPSIILSDLYFDLQGFMFESLHHQ